ANWMARFLDAYRRIASNTPQEGAAAIPRRAVSSGPPVAARAAARPDGDAEGVGHGGPAGSEPPSGAGTEAPAPPPPAAPSPASGSAAHAAPPGDPVGPDPGVEGLPLVQIPARAAGGSLFAVIVTGDGGWAGLDREVSGVLSAHGIPVVGLNSLQYFWH